MSISGEEKYHAVVLSRIWNAVSEQLPSAHFNVSRGLSRSSYIVSGLLPAAIGKGKVSQAGIFIKYATDRVTPWRYSFHKTHQDEILELKNKYGAAFVAFVAGDDGIACVTFEQLKEVLDESYGDVEWVSVSRKLRQNYRVSGADGRLEMPLPRNSFPGSVVDYFGQKLKK